MQLYCLMKEKMIVDAKRRFAEYESSAESVSVLQGKKLEISIDEARSDKDKAEDDDESSIEDEALKQI